MSICIAPIHETCLRRSAIAYTVKGCHSFTCTPCISSASRMSYTCLCLPNHSWYSFTDPGGWEAESTSWRQLWHSTTQPLAHLGRGEGNNSLSSPRGALADHHVKIAQPLPKICTLTSVPLFISVLVMVSYLLYTSVNLSAFADTDRLRQQVTSQYVVVCSSQDLVSSLSLNLHGCHANSGLLTDWTVSTVTV